MRSEAGTGFATLIKVCALVLLTLQIVRTYPHQAKEKFDSAVSFKSSESLEQKGQLQRLRRFSRNTWNTSRGVQSTQPCGTGDQYQVKSDEPGTGPSSRPGSNGSVHSPQGCFRSGQAVQGRVLANNGRAGQTQNDDAIVFPTDGVVLDRTKTKLHTRINVPKCEGSTYCENVDDYPSNVVDEAVRADESIKLLAVVDEAPEIAQRIDIEDDVFLCVAQENLVFPKTAQNKQKEWLFIANHEDLKQGIRVETCTNENSECNVVSGLINGYEMTCRQKYVYRQLIAIHDNNTLAPDMFRFPSSCCCHAKLNRDVLSRLGMGQRTQKNPVTPARTRRRK